MFSFLRSPKDDVLAEPRRLSTADYLCRLMEEQNQLLREMLLAYGRPSSVPKTSPAVNVRRVYTDKDVFRVTRQDTEQQFREAQEKLDAPWRSGPEPTQTSGTAQPNVVPPAAGT